MSKLALSQFGASGLGTGVVVRRCRRMRPYGSLSVCPRTSAALAMSSRWPSSKIFEPRHSLDRYDRPCKPLGDDRPTSPCARGNVL
jgi:hypothetical protein